MINDNDPLTTPSTMKSGSTNQKVALAFAAFFLAGLISLAGRYPQPPDLGNKESWTIGLFGATFSELILLWVIFSIVGQRCIYHGSSPNWLPRRNFTRALLVNDTIGSRSQDTAKFVVRQTVNYVWLLAAILTEVSKIADWATQGSAFPPYVAVDSTLHSQAALAIAFGLLRVFTAWAICAGAVHEPVAEPQPTAPLCSTGTKPASKRLPTSARAMLSTASAVVGCIATFAMWIAVDGWSWRRQLVDYFAQLVWGAGQINPLGALLYVVWLSKSWVIFLIDAAEIFFIWAVVAWHVWAHLSHKMRSTTRLRCIGWNVLCPGIVFARSGDVGLAASLARNHMAACLTLATLLWSRRVLIAPSAGTYSDFRLSLAAEALLTIYVLISPWLYLVAARRLRH